MHIPHHAFIIDNSITKSCRQKQQQRRERGGDRHRERETEREWMKRRGWPKGRCLDESHYPLLFSHQQSPLSPTNSHVCYNSCLLPLLLSRAHILPPPPLAPPPWLWSQIRNTGLLALCPGSQLFTSKFSLFFFFFVSQQLLPCFSCSTVFDYCTAGIYTWERPYLQTSNITPPPPPSSLWK